MRPAVIRRTRGLHFAWIKLPGVDSSEVPGATFVVRNCASWILQANTQAIRIRRPDCVDELIEDIASTKYDPHVVVQLPSRFEADVDR